MPAPYRRVGPKRSATSAMRRSRGGSYAMARPARTLSLRSGEKDFRFSMDLGTLTCPLANSAGGVGFTLQVQGDSMPDWTALKAIYNLYTYKKITYHLMPAMDCYEGNTFVQNASLATPVAFQVPFIWYAVDKTPYLGTPLSNVEVLSSQGAVLHQGDKPLSITVYNPQPSVTGPSLSQNIRRWVGTGSSESQDGSKVSWCGVKGWIEAPGLNPSQATTGVSFRVFATVTASFKEQW